MEKSNLRKKDFLMHEFYVLSIGGAFQRGNVYKKDNVSENDKKNFRDKLEKELILISNQYIEKEISGEKHIKNIQRLIDFSKNNKILNGEKLKLGTVQKLLNLYLKYLWSATKIKIPPHCPFDRIILGKLGIKDNWTQLNNLETYKEWVDVAQKEATKINLEIAEWELEAFNRR